MISIVGVYLLCKQSTLNVERNVETDNRHKFKSEGVCVCAFRHFRVLKGSWQKGLQNVWISQGTKCKMYNRQLTMALLFHIRLYPHKVTLQILWGSVSKPSKNNFHTGTKNNGIFLSLLRGQAYFSQNNSFVTGIAALYGFSQKTNEKTHLNTGKIEFNLNVPGLVSKGAARTASSRTLRWASPNLQICLHAYNMQDGVWPL